MILFMKTMHVVSYDKHLGKKGGGVILRIAKIAKKNQTDIFKNQTTKF